MKRYCLLYFIAYFSTSSLLAQEADEGFTVYTKQQGLSNNTITGIVQDSVGYIWVATPSGLNRFDGSQFLQYHSGSDSLSLPSENVKGLTRLDKRRLIAWGTGMHIIDTYTGQRRNLFISYSDRKYQFKFNGIKAITSDSEGDMYVLTSSGFYQYNKNYQLVYRFDYYSKNEVDTTNFAFGRKLLWLDQQHLVIISYAGIYYYSIKSKLLKKMQPEDLLLFKKFLNYDRENLDFFQPDLNSIFVLDYNEGSLCYLNLIRNQLSSIRLPFRSLANEFDYRSDLTMINDSTFYLAGKLSGYYELTLNKRTGEMKFDPKKYLASHYCKRIMQDKEHALWIATGQGLLKQNNFNNFVKAATIPKQIFSQFPNILLQDIYISPYKIYVSTRGNAGLLEFDRAFHFIKRISLEKIFRQPSSVYAFSAINNNELLLATSGPLCMLNMTTDNVTEVPLESFDRPNAWIADLYNDRSKNNIWITAGKIYRYSTPDKKSSLLPVAGIPVEDIVWPNKIQQDEEGNIWIAGHGLLRYNMHSRNFDKLIDSFPFVNIPDKQINSFAADQKGNLWINCNNNGLIGYNIKKGSFLHFTTKDGLPDNNIAAVIAVKNKLWMGGSAGVACMDLATYQITSFGKENGFPDESIAIGAKFEYDEKDNLVYIGFNSSIVAFDPDRIFRKKFPPELFIESIVTVNQKKFDFPGNQFVTSWHNSEATIRIGTIDFFTAGSQRFAYRIADDDKGQWQQLGSLNTFTVSNLSAGHHLIQIKLFSNSNQWPEQFTELHIMLTPPFWKTKWFLITSAFLILLLVYFIFRWRTRLIRKKEQAKTHLQKLIADEYKNQFELEQISNYFSSSLANKKNVDDVLWDVSKNLIGRMNYEDCMIYLWNKDKTKMVQKASFGPKGDPKAISESTFDVSPGQGVVGNVMISKESIIISDTRKDARYRVDDIERLSEICVPILHNGELLGIIDSEHPEVNHFQERDVKILTTIATLISNKIRQIESEQSLITKQKEIADINQRLAEAQLLALQTQMNPHFIFNSLNSIKRMILDDEQQRASRYMSKFANMLRMTLNQSKHVFTTLGENMEHLENYLAMEKLRFDDSFTFRITADSELDPEEILIPTMMIQPLAENAVWHGLIPKKGRKRLLIHFSKINDAVSCSIEDNGIGINRSEELKQLHRPLHQSVGISNLRNRIKILNEKYDTGCKLEITDLHDVDKRKTGSCATLTFQIINKPVYESNFS